MQPNDVKPKSDLHSLEAGLDALQLSQMSTEKRSIWERVLPPLAAIALVGIAWQWVFNMGFQPEWVIPSPQMVWLALQDQWQQGIVFDAVFNSLKRGITGFLMAVVIATPIGILVARVQIIRNVFGPVLAGLQQLPSVAWVPAAVIWFGLTPKTIYAVILLGAVPSIANGLVAGINQIPPLLLRVGKVMGAKGFATVRHILLPAALPGYLAGLEQGWAFAWRSLMAAELIAISPDLGAGLGQMLEMGRTLGDMSLMLGTIILILVAGIAVERLGFSPIRRRVLSNRGLGR